MGVFKKDKNKKSEKKTVKAIKAAENNNNTPKPNSPGYCRGLICPEWDEGYKTTEIEGENNEACSKKD